MANNSMFFNSYLESIQRCWLNWWLHLPTSCIKSRNCFKSQETSNLTNGYLICLINHQDGWECSFLFGVNTRSGSTNIKGNKNLNTNWDQILQQNLIVDIKGRGRREVSLSSNSNRSKVNPSKESTFLVLIQNSAK